MYKEVKRFLAVCISSILVLVGVQLLAPGPAQADTPGCATNKEYSRVDRGWTRARVSRVFDTDGRQLVKFPATDDEPAEMWRIYKRCSDKEEWWIVVYHWRMKRWRAVWKGHA